MPARLNEFQRLIRHIHEQLVPAGATVRESVMLENSRTKKSREIDVLIEHQVIDTTTRIAVESRDRSRCADVEWIDALVGKYRDLPVHHIIAVAKKGFTKGAEDHAASSDPRIELRTLREAIDTDWPATLMRVGMSAVAMSMQVRTCMLSTEPLWTGSRLPASIVRDLDSEPLCCVNVDFTEPRAAEREYTLRDATSVRRDAPPLSDGCRGV
jgi:hypothetical protein